jgi:AraC-like DNA-binding protein
MKRDHENILDCLPAKRVGFVLHKAKDHGYSLKWHAHKVYEIIYVDYGMMEMTVASIPISLKPCECIIIPPVAKHRFQGAGAKPFDFLNITFYGEVEAAITGRSLVLNQEEKNIIWKLKTEYLTENRFSNIMITIMLNQLILLLQRRFSTSNFEQQSVRITGENNLNYRTAVVSRALNFIRNNHMSHITAESVSHHVGTSTSHLRNLMRRETGHGFRHHLREIRMETARRYLRESTDNISEIAVKTGYSSLPHFSETFKKKIGKTPTEFARSLGTPSVKDVCIRDGGTLNAPQLKRRHPNRACCL